MSMRGKAPNNVTFIICLILYLVALLSYFGVIHLGGNVATWSWIVGYALLLIAVQVRGL
jgi:ABC-type multidrug transport system permease subunit